MYITISLIILALLVGWNRWTIWKDRKMILARLAKLTQKTTVRFQRPLKQRDIDDPEVQSWPKD